ncbi:unnamed protein product, partial [Staurois parvus]
MKIPNSETDHLWESSEWRPIQVILKYSVHWISPHSQAYIYIYTRSTFLNQGALKFLQGCLGKMSKNCQKPVYKPAGETKLPSSYTKPQVFIVHLFDLLAASSQPMTSSV